MTVLTALLDAGKARLLAAHIDGAERDATYLLLEATGLERIDLIVDPERAVDATSAAVFWDFVDKRCQHWPVGKIIGTTPFYGRNFHVNQNVLDPRSDSEALIDAALHWLGEARTPSEPVRILDMCTGSGCLGITLCAERPNTTCLGVDVDPNALLIADRNAAELDVSDRFMSLHSDMFDGLRRPFEDTAYEPRPPFDLILCNPPYIRSGEIADLMPEVRLHDPLHALDGGGDGLVFYRILLDEARDHLADRGALLMEIGADQAQDVQKLARTAGWTGECSVLDDLAGQNRAILVKPS